MSSTTKSSDEKKTFWTKIKSLFCCKRLDNNCEAVQVITVDAETAVSQKNDTTLQQYTPVEESTVVADSYENVDFARQPFADRLHGVIESDEPAGQSMMTEKTVTEDSEEPKPPTVGIECDQRLKKSTAITGRDLDLKRYSRVLRDLEVEHDWFLGLMTKWGSLVVPRCRSECGAERDDSDGPTDDGAELEQFATAMCIREKERDRLWTRLAEERTPLAIRRRTDDFEA